MASVRKSCFKFIRIQRKLRRMIPLMKGKTFCTASNLLIQRPTKRMGPRRQKVRKIPRKRRSVTLWEIPRTRHLQLAMPDFVVVTSALLSPKRSGFSCSRMAKSWDDKPILKDRHSSNLRNIMMPIIRKLIKRMLLPPGLRVVSMLRLVACASFSRRRSILMMSINAQTLN